MLVDDDSDVHLWEASKDVDGQKEYDGAVLKSLRSCYLLDIIGLSEVLDGRIWICRTILERA